MSRPKWEPQLRPYDEMYARMLDQIEEQLRLLADDELRQLIAVADSALASNCWWATYLVAPVVRDEAFAELRRRRRRPPAAGEASP